MTNLTTPQAAAQLRVPVWLARRLLDALEAQGVEVPRHGPYRVVTPALLERLRDELLKRAGGPNPCPRGGSQGAGAPGRQTEKPHDA